MSDEDEYHTAADALHLRRWERCDSDVRVLIATNEREKVAAVSAALAALPSTATYLDVQRAIWDAASAQAASLAARMMKRAVDAADAEHKAADEVNAIAARSRTTEQL